MKKNSSNDIEEKEDFIIDETKPCKKEYRNRRYPEIIIIIGVIIAVVIVVITVGVVAGVVRSTQSNDLPTDPISRAEALLKLYPIIDG